MKVSKVTKARDVLRRYAVGEREFLGVNLRGQSFKGKDLSGVDFSDAELHSTNFTDANLRGAKFCNAKCGLQKRWAIFLVILSWLLAGISGFGSFLAAAIVSLIFDSNLNNQIAGWVSLIVLATFLILIIRQGIRVAAIAGTGALAVAVALALALTRTGVVAVPIAGTGVAAVLVATAMLIAVLVLVAAAVAASVAIAGAAAGTVAITVAAAVAFTLVKALAIAILRDVAPIDVAIPTAIVVALTIGVALAVVVAGVYISWRAMKGDKRDAWVRSLSIGFAAIGGSSFRGADLTNADFTEATLKSTDFRKATLTRVRWYGVKMLNRVRSGSTYLSNQKLRQLVITGEGENENFDRLDLRGVNLQRANLENASFIDADFYQASLQGVNLSRTILVRANFERADLRGANLTGSCIQDWVITESTKLDGISCDYVYLRWANGDKRDQMPPRGKFSAGGFVTFVRYILETVELYHEKDINPRLALTVLQKMSREYDEPLNIVALGKKGERVFIQVKVSENIARENFKDDYYYRYDTDLKLWSGKNHQLPPAIDSFIEKTISEIASERTDDFVFVDATYVEGNYTEIQGEVNMRGDRNIKADIYNEQSGQFGIGIMNDCEFKDNTKIDVEINEAEKQNLADTATEIQQLLAQLSKTYPTTTSKEKNIVVGEAVDQIENNPTLKAKVINALKAGGTEAFKEAIAHPLVNILIATIEGWKQE